MKTNSSSFGRGGTHVDRVIVQLLEQVAEMDVVLRRQGQRQEREQQDDEGTGHRIFKSRKSKGTRLSWVEVMTESSRRSTAGGGGFSSGALSGPSLIFKGS